MHDVFFREYANKRVSKRFPMPFLCRNESQPHFPSDGKRYFMRQGRGGENGDLYCIDTGFIEKLRFRKA